MGSSKANCLRYGVQITNPPMPPKLDRPRAQFMLGRIDETGVGTTEETERDTKFVELGRYLCEVRQDSFGGWIASNRSMSFWRGDFQNETVHALAAI
jgi:hypothetical protein